MKDMHPDLEFLARNVSEWPKGAENIRLDKDGEVCFSGAKIDDEFDFYVDDAALIKEIFRKSNDGGWTGRLYGKSRWLQARKDLGLIMSDEEEEMKAEERPKRNLYEEIKEGFDALASDRTDNVNKPKHYQLREGYEVYDLRQDLAAKAANGGATYDQYSDWDRAIEYIIRMWGKNRLEDAKKGRWYLDKLIEKLEKQ